MRNTRETAEIIEQIVSNVHKERHKRKKLEMDTSYTRVVYVECKKYDCLPLFEHILKIATGK